MNRRGLLLALAEVEQRLKEIAGVAEAAVTSVEDTIRGSTLIAFCAVDQNTEMTGQQLRASYAELAPAFAVPNIVCIIDSLPELSDGKIDRQALASLAKQALRESLS